MSRVQVGPRATMQILACVEKTRLIPGDTTIDSRP